MEHLKMPYGCCCIGLLLIILCEIEVVISAGEKADQKCKEYGEAVYSYEESPVLAMRMLQEKVSHCGIVDIPLIIGGVRAQDMEFPHMAAIGYESSSEDEIKWLCGGSLISDQFILTAAHCVNSPDNGPAVKVLLGTIDLSSDEEDVQLIEISERIPHPRYKPPLKYNDIALLRLERPVNFTKYIRPACVKPMHNNLPEILSASGFGKQSYDSVEGSKYLMKVQLTVFSYKNCKEKFFRSRTPALAKGLQTNMMCVGELSGGKDTCQGDSGGPLQTVLKEPYCMYNIIGVTSFGKFCGLPNSPSIYTKVEDFIDWIESVVWP